MQLFRFNGFCSRNVKVLVGKLALKLAIIFHHVYTFSTTAVFERNTSIFELCIPAQNRCTSLFNKMNKILNEPEAITEDP